MNSAEYDKLARVEREHWFYRGKREIVRHWLRKSGGLTKDSLLVDCGAGSGLFAREMADHCRVLAVDDHDEALDLAVQNLGKERVLRGSCTSLPLADASVNCVTALDVIEHVEDDHAAVREFARVLKPGGTVVITVPAFQMLWSDWDVVLHHYRRYNREMLAACLSDAQLEIKQCRYINVLAFPAVLAARKLRAFARSSKANSTRLEDRIPPRALNEAMLAAFVGLGCQQALDFPFGVGLLAVAQRPV